MDADELLERLRKYEGQSVAQPVRARDPVNQPMIRHWCDAVDDRNPVYTDPEFAARSVHGGIVAPPTMLQAWSMRGLQPPDERAGRLPGPQAALFGLLDEAGFTSVVATNCTQDYIRYLALGDDVEVATSIESVSEEKQTALGAGHFITQRMAYTDQGGQEVATMRFRLLKFRPRERSASAGPAAAPPAPASAPPLRTPERSRETRRRGEVEPGEELPGLDVEITPTVIVAGAIASRDYQDVHHDHAKAIERGSKDIFMNILTTNGWVGRYVTDWAGPEALLRRVDIRLGVPNYPGDTMRFSGRVAEKDGGVLRVEIAGRNDLGNHVTGHVDVELPG